MKNCQYCSDPISGRIDKKFCNDYCRNAFNNERVTRGESLFRPIYQMLKQNRKALQRLADADRVTFEELKRNGFNFHFLTHQKVSSEGVEIYCFDFGYRAINSEQVEILREVG